MSTVSVIIPCFNAEKWLSEAIDSVLAQTYEDLEVIVIDDGSSDRSLEIIQSYGDRLIWHTGENQGANHARNRGFALSTGDYLQYLDADDYLLPDKIAKQVQCLQTTAADFVYSDWRYQHHLDNGEIHLDESRICGVKEDFLYSLLANDRWSNLAPILFRRSILNRVSWDENLQAAQDRGFLLSVMLAGAKCVYQSGCDSIYRMHQGSTVSTASKLRWFEAHCLVMELAEKKLLAMGLLNNKYQQALATAYWEMGKEYLYSNNWGKSDREPIPYNNYAAILDKVARLAPELFLQNKNKLYQTIYKLMGYQLTEKLSYFFHSQKANLSNK
jgi:glycosyltransferase involved in cell wall biosynthesis